MTLKSDADADSDADNHADANADADNGIDADADEEEDDPCCSERRPLVGDKITMRRGRVGLRRLSTGCNP